MGAWRLRLDTRVTWAAASGVYIVLVAVLLAALFGLGHPDSWDDRG